MMEKNTSQNMASSLKNSPSKAERNKDKYNDRYGKNENLFRKDTLYDEIMYRPQLEGFSGKVLDLGCGQGRHCIKFANDGCEVTGVDISDVAIQQLKNKAVHEEMKIRPICSDIETYQIEEKYDLILLSHALHLHSSKRASLETLKK